ncbi:chemotaxis protein CheX [Campylobacter sp.]|uniref:chemotaxis protein CheX n=1 Tax=Campylobacter sp. TaxID=205 RepID=UPI0025C1BDD0|nr:chemotaxis protein CheX [Campylobacter sp.]
MNKTLEYSIHHFFVQVLKLKIEPVNTIKGELYGASIPIHFKDKEYSFYLFFQKKALNEIALFLLHEELKEDGLADLVKEVANQVVGYTKKLLNDANGKDEFKLGVPEYLGHIEKLSSIKLKEKFTYSFKDSSFRIGYKNL